MSLREIFKKQGGVKLLKQYWKSGAFFTAVGEFILLGKSRTALEILRLSAQLKTKQKLEKNYRKYVTEFDSLYDDNLSKVTSNKVWVCWFQGIENAPNIVRNCYYSLKKNLKDREIILITDDNYKKYVEFPDYIQEKIDNGIISKTHMSDLLRLELLIRYGGTWIDSTVYCSSEDIPDYMLSSELFVFQCLKPGKDGHTTVVSNWFITACTNNKILMCVRYLIYEYWRRCSEVIDYYIFHDLFQIVIEYYEDEWNKVIPFDNAVPHILLLRLFEKYDEKSWMAIKKQTPFHKLTYKFSEENANKNGTYFEEILSLLDY